MPHQRRHRRREDRAQGHRPPGQGPGKVKHLARQHPRDEQGRCRRQEGRAGQEEVIPCPGLRAGGSGQDTVDDVRALDARQPGVEALERCNQGWTVASTALASGVPTSVWLTGDAVRFAVPGYAATQTCERFRSSINGCRTND